MKLSEIRDKRIFITGGTGFFGKSLLQHPVVESNYVVLLSRNPQHLVDELPNLKNSNNIDFIEGDVRHFNCNDFDFDYIIHGAATSSRIIPDDEMKSVVTEGSKRVIEFARKNHNLSRLLYISSGAVYGNRHDGLISEDMSCEPGNVYGSVKLRAEQYCALGNIPYCIARCFAFVGGYLPLDEHFAIGNFIRDCLENRDIIIKGDGTPTRTYLYSGDLSTWLWTILFNGIEGRIYNVGSDYEVSISQLAELVRNISGSTNDIQILSPPSGKPIHRYGPNISRARQELQLDVETSLEEAIRLTLKQHKSF